MNLKHIKEEACPTCGSEVLKEFRSATMHINGTRQETREFECGLALVYIPNFQNVGVPKWSYCSNDLKEIEKQKRRKLAKEKLVKYINKMKTDDAFKKDLQVAISWKK